jgi:serine/threonine protein kinase
VKRLAAYGESVEGTPFGRYRLIELLGRGGMGEVWRAYDPTMDRVVALKVLPPNFAGDKVFQERFRREARAAAGLDEPHVVPFHEFGEIDGRLYVTMRLIKGRDLQSMLADGPLPPARAVGIIEQIASALHAAHEIGLVHRDVKPSNILVARDDFAYLIDFGIARGAEETRMTGTGSIIGSWQYMSPERLRAGHVDARCDIYALACVLYECLTGRPPYPGDNLEQQITAHLTEPPPRPSSTDPNVPAMFDPVIATGMAKNPDQRYPTTVELAHAARDAITTPIRAAEPTMPAPPPTGPAPYPPVESVAPPGDWPIPSGVSPAAPTQLGPPQPPQQWSGLETPRPDQKPPARTRRGRRALWAAIAAGVAAGAVVVTVVLVMTNRHSGAGSVSAPSAKGAESAPAPNTGPFTGTFSADFGPLTRLDGTPAQGTPEKETWNLRSVCGASGCVATASRASGNTSFSSALVFDDVAGRWLAVGVTPGPCKNAAAAEIWEAFSLQPRPDGTLTGEYTTTSPAGCDSKRTVTFTRTGDARVDLLNDPAGLPARVASPAQALHGSYHDTVTFPSGAPQGYDFSVRTDCLRSGDRCLSFLYRETVKPFVFAGGKWSWNDEYDGPCSAGGTSHTKVTAEYPLPQPPQDPITLLTGHGHGDSTGSACTSTDFDEKYVRTGD